MHPHLFLTSFIFQVIVPTAKLGNVHHLEYALSVKVGGGDLTRTVTSDVAPNAPTSRRHQETLIKCATSKQVHVKADARTTYMGIFVTMNVVRTVF